ncbi:MAG: hypothetical protein D6726_10330 [Nitrospirae bacterium]|nr:MAG: hypothetical protein D6726_10330 [Nitrospirota bacterium]
MRVLPKGRLLAPVLVFLFAYLFSLFFWIQVKDDYGFIITHISSWGLEKVKDVKIEGIKKKDGEYVVTISPERFKSMLVVDVPVKTSTYTFNAPLTFSIIAAFFLPLRRRFAEQKRKDINTRILRIYLETVGILIFVHILFVFSLEGERLTGIMMTRGYEDVGVLKLGFWQFLWGFVDNMVIRFEPFLIGAYLYFRGR